MTTSTQPSKPWRPRKLDREATQTATRGKRWMSAAERSGLTGWRSGAKPERGPCTRFDRGPAMNKAIAKAAKFGALQ